jgi:predicted CXXCH cytochrome family protein
LQVTTNEDCEECHAGAWEEHNMQLKAAGNDDCMSCHGVLMGRTTLAPIQLAHSEYHAPLVCVACHDASGLEVGPIEGQAAWVTFRTIQTPGGTSTDPYQSHTLQKAVSCDRCHFADNPWDLIYLTIE